MIKLVTRLFYIQLTNPIVKMNYVCRNDIILMQASIKSLIQRGDVSIFDRTPVHVEKKLHNEKQSDTLYALLSQLKLLEKIDNSIINKNEITEEIMWAISFKSKTNFLFIDPVVTELHYYVHIIDGGFNNTMIIYTSERDMFDSDEHLNLILNCNPRIEDKKMFHEYVLTYDSINKHKLSIDEEFYHYFEYDKDNKVFCEFPGTRYDAAIYASYCSWLGIDAYSSINDGEPMLLKNFVLYLMKVLVGSNVIVVVIFDSSYYVFGSCGYCGFTVIEINNSGVITIPNITLNTLLNNYKVGDVSNILNEIVLN